MSHDGLSMPILPELLIASPTLQDALVGKDGLPLIAGVVTCYQDDSRTTLKNWYYQSGTPGNYEWIALPNPLTLSAAGTIQDAMGNDVIPFFYPWLVDSYNEEVFQPYYITVYNSQGQLQFTRAYFPFLSSQVNPTPLNDIYTLENYIINNRFWRNIGGVKLNLLSPNQTSGVSYVQTGDFGLSYNDTPNPPHYYYATIAPSQNDGFSMPDINYIKNAQGGTEDVQFIAFPSSTSPALTGDVMPEYYLQHTCTTNESGVTLKCYQFPISLHLDTLAGQPFSVSIQAKSSSNSHITFSLYQFQGTGNTSIQPVPFYTATLSQTWEKYSASDIFPDNLNVLPSTTGDDAWYLQIGLPLSQATFDVEFTLPSLYLNPVQEVPTNSFASYDQIDAVILKPRTGDIRISLNNLYPYGWLPMNGGTVGNGSSNATLRPNIDAWPLFYLLWTSFNSLASNGNPLISIYDSLGDPSTYGTSAYLDWEASKSIALTQTMGQVMLGTVPLSALLSLYTSSFTANQLSSLVSYSNSNGSLLITCATSFPLIFGEIVQLSGTLPSSISAVTNYYLVPVSSNSFFLSTTLGNAQAGYYIPFATGGGTSTVYTFSLILSASNKMNMYTGMPLTFQTTGALPTGILANTIYYAAVGSPTNFGIANTFNDAINGNLIAYTDSGTGINTAYTSSSGSNEGEYGHSQLSNQVGPHSHTGTTNANFSVTGTNVGAGSSNLAGYPVSSLSLSINNNNPNGGLSNVTQPGTYTNIYIKL